MKNKCSFMVISALFLSVLLPTISNADEISNVNKESSINVQLVESPIRFTDIKPPEFEVADIDYEADQKIKAVSDLVIHLADNRAGNLASWGIQYKITAFKNTSEENSLVESAVYNIGKGTLSSKEKAIDSSFYQSHSVNLKANENGTLLQTSDLENGDFTYRILKDDISISIPNSSKQGTYQAVQTITLVNLPFIDE